MLKAFYSTVEIAKMFHVYTTTVADWIDSGRLIAYRTAGGHRRVRPEDLRAFLREMNMPIPNELQSSAKPTVLVVDDDPDLTTLMKSSLARRHLIVETATSGFEGIYKIGRICPDVVILDIHLPGLDGVQVCEEIKSTDELKHIVVIAISGDEDMRDVMLAKGADAFLRKPFRLSELSSMISALAAHEAHAGSEAVR